MKETYCPNDIMERLIHIGAPLTKVFTANRYTPIYYTKQRTDPDWENCDAYYKPTVGAVIDWLLGNGYFISIVPTRDKVFYVCVINVINYNLYTHKTKCFKSKLEAQISGINEAIDVYMFENGIR